MRPVAGLWALLSAIVGAATVVFASERDLGAHRHGHGAVNIVIEGSTVWIELRAPGSDIVGFEHAPESSDEFAAIEAARAMLESPLALFELAPDPDCSVQSAAVILAGEDRDETQGRDSGDGREDGGEGGHAEFHAEYEIACAAPQRIGRIVFTYFSRFPAAQELDVTVITAKRQSRYEVQRSSPLVRLEAN